MMYMSVSIDKSTVQRVVYMHAKLITAHPLLELSSNPFSNVLVHKVRFVADVDLATSLLTT